MTLPRSIDNPRWKPCCTPSTLNERGQRVSQSPCRWRWPLFTDLSRPDTFTYRIGNRPRNTTDQTEMVRPSKPTLIRQRRRCPHYNLISHYTNPSGIRCQRCVILVFTHARWRRRPALHRPPHGQNGGRRHWPLLTLAMPICLVAWIPMKDCSPEGELCF